MDWTSLKKRKRSSRASSTIEDSNSSASAEEKSSSKPKLGTDDTATVTSSNNHIYFYSEVNRKSILSLNKELRSVSSKLLDYAHRNDSDPANIYLHINSYGGSVHAAFAGIDTILNCKVPVVTIIEGCAASAATMLSVVGKERRIHKHAHMLIHQLSSSMWGQMDDLEEEIENLKSLMKTIKGIYEKYTTIPAQSLDEILKHDQWWDADKCLSHGLVDSII